MTSTLTPDATPEQATRPLLARVVGLLFAPRATLATVAARPSASARETLPGVTNLMVFFPVLDEHSFAANFLGTIDLVYVWWIASVAIGLGVLYRRRTGPIATTLLVTYAAIALVIAAI